MLRTVGGRKEGGGFCRLATRQAVDQPSSGRRPAVVQPSSSRRPAVVYPSSSRGPAVVEPSFRPAMVSSRPV
uniref:Uncharacterized protein n=1 Tax=Caenorhabditis japonica TaxID=281687 RepID=A0A8R1EHV2_CAEJA